MNILLPRPDMGVNKFEVFGSALPFVSAARIPASKGVLIQGLGVVPRKSVRPLSPEEVDTVKAVSDAATDPNACFDQVFRFPASRPVSKSIRADADSGEKANKLLDSIFPFFLEG